MINLIKPTAKQHVIPVSVPVSWAVGLMATRLWASWLWAVRLEGAHQSFILLSSPQTASFISDALYGAVNHTAPECHEYCAILQPPNSIVASLSACNCLASSHSCATRKTQANTHMHIGTTGHLARYNCFISRAAS